MRTVKVSIEKNGNVTVDVDGTCGPSCEDITQGIQRALAADVVSDTKKPAYYEHVQASDVITAGY